MRKRTKWVIFFVVTLIALALATLWIRHQLEIDACMDKGGRWDHKGDTCSFVENMKPEIQTAPS